MGLASAPHQPLEGMLMVALIINDVSHQLDIEPDTPLLWVLRDELGLTGTKYGCGIALMRRLHRAFERRGDASRARSRSAMPTAPGSPPSRGFRPTASIRCNRPGSPRTCRNAAIASPARSWRPWACSKDLPDPSDADIDAGLTNICRCGTYPRIRAAIHRAASMMKG